MKKILFASIMMVVLNAGAALAQPHPEMMKGLPPMAPCLGPSPVDILDLLDLSAQQKVKMVALLKKQVEDMERDEAEFRKTDRGETFRAMQDATMRGDVEAVRTFARAMSEEHEQHAVEMAKFIAEFRSILGDTQRAKIDKLHAHMKARLEVARGSGRPEDGKHPEEMEGKGQRERMMPENDGPRGHFPPRPDVKRVLEEWIKQNS